MVASQVLPVVCLALLAMAAMHDVASRTVPNWIAGCIALAGIVVQIEQGTMLAGSLLALGLFLVLMVFWRRGWPGGADVKLIAAAALLVPPGSIPALIFAVTVSGSALAMPYLIARRRIGVPALAMPAGLLARIARAERWRLRRGGPLPYAVAIASGTAITVFTGGTF